MSTIEQTRRFREMVARLTEIEARAERAARRGDIRATADYRTEARAIRSALALQK